MRSEVPIAEFDLADGLQVSVFDKTSHYYGGYFHVRLKATVVVPLQASMFDSNPAYDDALDVLGTTLTFERILEKMAVQEAMVELVKQELLASFRENVLPYLKRSDFAARFAASEFERKSKTKTFGYVRKA